MPTATRSGLSHAAALRKDKQSAAGTHLQHRHFALIASVIAAIAVPFLRGVVSKHFATALARTNPNFNRHRFLAACRGDDAV